MKGLNKKIFELIKKSWSTDLAKKYPNAQWRTINGARVLLRFNDDGTAVVVAGSKQLEHRVFSKEGLSPKKDSTEANKEAKNDPKKKIEAVKASLKKNFEAAIIKKFAEKAGILPQNGEQKTTGNKAKKIVEIAKKQLAGEPIDSGLSYSEAQDIVESQGKIEDIGNISGSVSSAKRQIVETKKALIGLFGSDSFTKKTPDLETQEFNEARLAANWAFYDTVGKAQKTIKGAASATFNLGVQKGAGSSLTAIAQSLGISLPNADKLISVVGVDQAANILIQSMSQEERQAVKDIYKNNAEELVNTALKDAVESQAISKQLYDLAREGTIEKSRAGLALAQASKDATNKISYAAGSLQMGAALANPMGDFSVKSKEKANEILALSGLKGKATIKESNGKFSIELNRATFNDSNSESIVDRLKRNEVATEDARVAGMPDLQANGKPNIKLKPDQLHGVAYILGDDKSEGVGRGVLNFGAGIGKTVTYMAMVAKMKQDGKLNSPAVIAVPSRLRAEFGNDHKNFFHNLSMLNIDGVDKSMGLAKFNKQFNTELTKAQWDEMDSNDVRKSALENAKGNFDIILTGHDTAKSKKMMDGLKQLNPSITIVDESHEVVTPESGSAESSQKMKAFQELAKNSDKFVAGTGTLLRQGFGEVADIVSMARPDLEQQSRALSKQAQNMGKTSGVFDSLMKDKIAKDLKDVILTRATDLSSGTGSPQLKRDRKLVNLSDKQSKSFKDADKTYYFEKNNEGKIGFLNPKTGDISKIAIDPKDIALSGGLDNFKEKNNLSGYNSITLGGDNAVQRKVSTQRNAVYGGNWKENSIAQAMVDSLKGHFNTGNEGKASVFYSKDIKSAAKPTIESALKEGLGLNEGQYLFIDGDVSHKERATIKKKYQEDPNVKVIVFNDAGATGLNLQAGTHTVHYSNASSAAVDEQAYRRHYRTGQQKDVSVLNLDANIPSAIWQKQKIKQQQKMIGLLENQKIAKACIAFFKKAVVK